MKKAIKLRPSLPSPALLGVPRSEAPQQPGVHRAEAEPALLVGRLHLGNVVQQPAELEKSYVEIITKN